MSNDDYQLMIERTRQEIRKRTTQHKEAENTKSQVQYNLLLPITPEQLEKVLRMIESEKAK